MKIYRQNSFQKFKPKLNQDGTRLPICEVDKLALTRIQRGVMHYEWRGIMCNKNVFDLSLYTKLLWELKPRTVIEIGYKYGGSALWFVDQAKAMDLDLSVYAIDVEQREQVTDPRIEFTNGNARDLGANLTPEVLSRLPKPWLIIEDADHHYISTLKVLEFFAPIMSEGDYMAVEDGICDTFGNEGPLDGGPNRAIFEFFEKQPKIFEVDAHYCDFYGNNVTWCTNGYLRRTAEKFE